jgi:hypothetical protein
MPRAAPQMTAGAFHAVARLSFEGCDRPVAGTGQDGEGDERPVATLDLGGGRQRSDDMPDLLQRRHTRVFMRLGYKSRISYSDAEYFNLSAKETRIYPG